MSTVQEIEAAIQSLPVDQVAIIHNWLDEYYEDQIDSKIIAQRRNEPVEPLILLERSL